MPEWLKQDIVGLTGLTRDALHVHIGLGLMLAAAALLKGRHVLRAWLFVLTAELLNEATELSGAFPDPSEGDWSGSLHDIANTMFWPTLVLVAVRLGLVRLFPASSLKHEPTRSVAPSSDASSIPDQASREISAEAMVSPHLSSRAAAASSAAST